MRAVLIVAAAFACLIGVIGCAEDSPSPEEVQEQFHRGVTGQGQLTPGNADVDDTGVKPQIGESDVPR